MGWKFSPSCRGFFHDSVHATFPEDCVDVTEKAYQALFVGLADVTHHRVLGVSPKGQPILVEPPPPGPEQIKANARHGLSELDAVSMKFFRAGLAWPEDWKAHAAALRRIAATGEVPEGGWPSPPELPEELIHV